MSENRYDPHEVEPRWRRVWEEMDLFHADLEHAERPCYALVMFAYPSGDRLHVGHWYHYGPADSWARHMRMRGYDVFEPFGFDAFGLPAENYAVRTGVHPKDSTDSNVANMIAQLKAMGAMWDWARTLNTSEPLYYRWTQWLFLKLYEAGLAYRREAPVWWCPTDQTVLANEQVVDGRCERCDTLVEQRAMEQWFFRITRYADELLAALDTLPGWPERVKTMQANWIGKSYGVRFAFPYELPAGSNLPSPSGRGHEGGGAPSSPPGASPSPILAATHTCFIMLQALGSASDSTRDARYFSNSIIRG